MAQSFGVVVVGRHAVHALGLQRPRHAHVQRVEPDAQQCRVCASCRIGMTDVAIVLPFARGCDANMRSVTRIRQHDDSCVHEDAAVCRGVLRLHLRFKSVLKCG